MTPQVARIDAHLLNRQGVTRLCYAGNVLHTRPRGLHATREQIQIGAEIYGHAGIEADLEIQQLLLDTLHLAGLSRVRLDLCHAGVLAALINRSTPNSDLATQFVEKYVATADGLKTIDADVPIGVPALKSLSDEMAAKNPLIKTTYENAKNGDVMPNIPQMGKFWSSMATAFQIAANGQASPKAALDDAKKNMGK